MVRIVDIGRLPSLFKHSFHKSCYMEEDPRTIFIWI